MARSVLVVSLVTAAFFAVSFGLTFVSGSYVIGHARDYVIVRTERYATPVVDTAERALRTPGARRLIDDEYERRADEEIAEYHRDPRAYISRLVATLPTATSRPATMTTTTAPTRRGKAREVIERLKADVHDHFARTFRRLMTDLRIFTGTNVVAALIAAALAKRWGRDTSADGEAHVDNQEDGGRMERLAWVAALLLGSVAFSSYQYVNHLSYFTILLNSYVGWWYPVLLAGTFFETWWKYGRRR
jgi:hypothetical protein